MSAITTTHVLLLVTLAVLAFGIAGYQRHVFTRKYNKTPAQREKFRAASSTVTGSIEYKVLLAIGFVAVVMASLQNWIGLALTIPFLLIAELGVRRKRKAALQLLDSERK